MHSGLSIIKRYINHTLTIIIISILHLSPSNVAAETGKYFFYRPENTFGTDGIFNPLYAVVNGGFDILRVEIYEKRDITNIKFRKNARLVNWNLRHPRKAIKYYNSFKGDNFLDELYPRKLDPKKSNWIPNYTGHLIGEGMIFRLLVEWYDKHEYPLPYFLGFLTAYSFSYLNEVTEYEPRTPIAVDPIADLLIFNPLGIALFSLDPVARFFGDTLNMSYWGLQPVFNPYSGILSNVGEQYVIKMDVPKSDSYKFFCSWGFDMSFGLSRIAENKLNYSLGFGLRVDHLKKTINENKSIVNDPQVKPQMVIFIDRNESLLFSFSQTSINHLNYKFNIYPGMLKARNLGGYIAYSRYVGFELGITYYPLPVGLFTRIK